MKKVLLFFVILFGLGFSSIVIVASVHAESTEEIGTNANEPLVYYGTLWSRGNDDPDDIKANGKLSNLSPDSEDFENYTYETARIAVALRLDPQTNDIWLDYIAQLRTAVAASINYGMDYKFISDRNTVGTFSVWNEQKKEILNTVAHHQIKSLCENEEEDDRSSCYRLIYFSSLGGVPLPPSNEMTEHSIIKWASDIDQKVCGQYFVSSFKLGSAKDDATGQLSIYNSDVEVTQHIIEYEWESKKGGKAFLPALLTMHTLPGHDPSYQLDARLLETLSIPKNLKNLGSVEPVKHGEPYPVPRADGERSDWLCTKPIADFTTKEAFSFPLKE
ncbi:MAG: hypothetical protein KDD48_01575 [Bdellovibrionales bacterium]|nr:hypothetical protein [Bdellovibrionales bacterium]